MKEASKAHPKPRKKKRPSPHPYPHREKKSRKGPTFNGGDFSFLNQITF
jgi:hypothetical protein